MSLIEFFIVLGLLWFVVLPVVMLLLYAIFIQHGRGGLWRVLKLVALVAWPLDVIMTYIWFPLYLEDFPGKGEWTVSQQIDRLVLDGGLGPRFEDGTSYKRACKLGRLLNRIDPLHNHIKSLALRDALVINDEGAA